MKRNSMVRFTVDRKKYRLSEGKPYFIGKVLQINGKTNTAKIRFIDVFGDCEEYIREIPIERCEEV